MSRRPPEALVLALDIGSSSTRSAFFDEKARVVAGTNASREYGVRYSAEGGAELSPTLILRAARTCLAHTLHARDQSPALRKIRVASGGASAFWHSLLGLDAKGRPVTPIYMWADSRCTPDAFQLRHEFSEIEIHARTGCMLRATFWPAKLRWLRRTQGRLFQKVARWVSPAEWIFEELLGVAGVSYSMASATGLYDLRVRRWDRQLCDACGVDLCQLGQLTEDGIVIGRPRPALHGASILTAIGDGSASNLGCGADIPGRIAINMGTSGAVRTVERRGAAERYPLPAGLFRFALDRDRTLLGGAVSNAGNLRRWCLRELRVDASGPETHQTFSREAAAADTLTVLPFWVAERAPTWPEGLHGTIIGLTQTVTAAEIFRATTCSVFYRLGEILDRIDKAAGRSKDVIVSGGLLHSPPALRLLADALGRDIRASTVPEASLRGAAVQVLTKLGGAVIPPLRAGRLIRHDRKLAKMHLERRRLQADLEKTLQSA